MLTQKLMAQDVSDELFVALKVHGISENDFLRKVQCNDHLLANLRDGDSIRTGTIQKLYSGVIEHLDKDWTFRHELQANVICRAKAQRFIRGLDDGLQQAVFALTEWERKLRRG